LAGSERALGVKRADLEHIIRASAAISGDDEIVVVGSQAILGQFPSAPPELCVSDEADVYPRNHPERADLIEGSIGELSPFHSTFGYYAQGVAPTTATLPSGWEQRLIAVRNPNTRDATGWCLEVHDLVLAKYVAGREKDRDFIAAVIKHGLIARDVLEQRLGGLPVDDQSHERIAQRIAADFGA
jgi:hypothetical protein